MRLVVQRVSRAKVTVDDRVTGEIGAGLVVLIGISPEDTAAEVTWAADKIVNLRIFEDGDGKMNASLLESGGEVLLVSQFTLYGDARKGRRPSFIRAARGEVAEALYEGVETALTGAGVTCATGEFGASMDVELINQGPVTILLDSEKTF
ncbi:MAG: D-tyrosyl-tRNA(Tyr) deacylase [Actinobacteria bacterium]|nr:D-tyrosyl-tRNA(Tyr) deacylase [Actinomycetota bacterium]